MTAVSPVSGPTGPKSVQDLMDRVAKKDAETGWVRETVGQVLLDDLARNAIGSTGRIFASSDSVTFADDKHRFIYHLSPYAPFTAGELARTWLESVCNRAGVTRLAGASYVGGPAFGPSLFFDPPTDRGGEWVMIDVKACYWTLYSRLAFDCCFSLSELPETVTYDAGGRVRVPEEDKVWIGAEKPLRNAAWGVMCAERLYWTTEGGRSYSKPNRSRLRAPGLTQAVLAQVQAIATEARELGATMWLTDAAICRPDDMVRIHKALANWGLFGVTKAEGPGRLYGLGDYKIGDTETAGGHIERGPHNTLLPLTQTTRDRLATL